MKYSKKECVIKLFFILPLLFHSAASVGQLSLLSVNQTVSKTNVYSAGALLNAVERQDLAQVEKILTTATGYNIDEVNRKGETPLLIATHNNAIAIAKRLIDYGADINKQDTISDSPYLYAGAQGKTAILKYMLAKATPDYTKRNRYGGNALIPAAEKGHLENVRLLLKIGKEDVNLQNKFGYTALIEVVALNNGSILYQTIAKELLAHGADVTLKDNKGYTAIDYARTRKQTAMLKLLMNQ